MTRHNTALWGLAIGASFAATLLLAAKCSAQPYPNNWGRDPMWGPPAYSTYQYYMAPRRQINPGGYRFFDAPLSEGLAPRWSDPRAQWPQDYRYRRECWFRNGC